MKNENKSFVVNLRQPNKSVSRHGRALFYFASEVFKAIEDAGGRVEFVDPPKNNNETEKDIAEE